MVKSGDGEKKKRRYRKQKEEEKSREKMVIEILIPSGRTTGEITTSMGYDKRDYHNIADVLPRMKEEGKIESRKLKIEGRPGPVPSYWEIKTLKNIKNSIGENDHLIPLVQRSDKMLDIIAGEYKKYLPMESLREHLSPEFEWIANAGLNFFKKELLEYLSSSPTFFKMLVKNDPEETSKIIERHSDPFGLQEGEDLLCEICPWRSGENPWCDAEGGVSCQMKEGLERNKRIFSILTFYRYCLADDAIENPKDELFIKKLEEAEGKIYWYRSFLGIKYVHYCFIGGIRIIKNDEELMEKQRERLKEIMEIIEGPERVDFRVQKEIIEMAEALLPELELEETRGAKTGTETKEENELDDIDAFEEKFREHFADLEGEDEEGTVFDLDVEEPDLERIRDKKGKKRQMDTL